MSPGETRSDALPARRDEVAAQLRHLADLVEHDRWEEAGKLMDTAHDGFMSVFAAWNKLRFKRNLAAAKHMDESDPDVQAALRRIVNEMGVRVSTLTITNPYSKHGGLAGRGEQLEANRYGFTADVRRHAP